VNCYDLAIVNGNIYVEGEFIRGNLYIDNGIIKNLSKDIFLSKDTIIWIASSPLIQNFIEYVPLLWTELILPFPKSIIYFTLL